MKVRVADYIADFFAKNEITDVFSVTGGGAMHMNDALGHHNALTVTYNHHEQACSIAAEAYTRLTGKLAVCCVTSGPGGTNAITGAMGGWLDSIPMFILSGQVKRETTIWSVPELGLRQLGDQEFDIVHTVANMTKYAVMVTNENEIAYHLEKALYLAKEGRGGPVWVDVPLDVQGAKIETDDLVHFDAAKEAAPAIPSLCAQEAQSILAKIAAAKRPLILVGTGIRLGDAENELLRFAEKMQLPIVTAWNANDVVGADSPYFAGMPGTVGTRGGNFVVQNCDLFLSLGCRLNIRMISYNKRQFAENAYKIVVDIDEKELKKPTIVPDLPIHGDVKQVLGALLQEDYTPVAAHEAWLSWCRTINARYPAALPEYHGSEKLNPYVFMDQMFDALDKNDTIVCGNGSACVMTFQASKIKQGQRMFTNSGCAAMGYGLPGALGAAVAKKDGRVICVDGDGSIMMNIQELATVALHKQNMKIILLNNAGYHSIRQTQTNIFQPPLIGVGPESGVGFPDFAKLADAFGIPYRRIDNEASAPATLAELLAVEGPVLCEVVVDETQNFAPKLSSKVLPDGKIVSPKLDDMFPFLPEEEYRANHFEG